MITISDIEGLIAFAITNNRQGFINAMNSSGYPVPSGISDDDLYSLGVTVLTEKGTQAIVNVLNRVQLDKAKVNPRMKERLTEKFAPVNQRGFGDWFNGALTYVGDLIGGSSVSTSPTTSVQSTSALSPGMLGLITVFAVILMVMFRKSVVLVIAMIVVVIGVVLYGIFAKNVTSSTTAGTTQTHGGLGQALLALIGL